MTDVLARIARPGDRWELARPPEGRSGGSLPLDPSWDLLLAAGEPVTVECPDGRTASARYSPEQHELAGRALAGLVSGGAEKTWFLELCSVDPLRFRLAPDEPAVAPFEPEVITERGVRLAFSPDDLTLLTQRPTSWPAFELSRRAAAFATSYGFDRLVSLPLLRDVEPYEHQLKTVRTVLRRFRGRALLCDEVGLGKTVEAGMILLELLVRKLIRRILILTPPSLVEQWKGEMRHKFGVDFIAHDDPAFREPGPGAWAAFERILASYHTAKREPHRAAILAEEWDLVVVDEAHHFRNRGTLLFKFASALRTKFILLLTATPLQNNLEELFNLVTLLHPGLLGTARRFEKQFVDRRDKLTPKNLDRLHESLAEAMVRNRRATAAVRFTRRYARTFRVAPLPAERALYGDVSHFVKAHLRTGASCSRLSLVTLKKAMGSSGQAAAGTLERLRGAERLDPAERETLAELAARARRQTESAKLDTLREILRDFPDKLVLFTQFRATQDLLHRVLGELGEPVALFHGGLTRLEKEAAVRAFERDARILLTTDSGSEGRNLQFCHALLNFDLPWNPMRIEQRIGRLSRIGQTRDVHVFTLVAAGTFEDDLLHLLEVKINLFELVMGEMDMILGNLAGDGEEREFEELVVDLWLESEDDAEFRGRLAEMGDRLAAAKSAYLRQRDLDDRLFGDRFVPEG